MGVDLEKTQTPFIPYRIPAGVPMRVGFGICQGRRLCRLRDGNGWSRVDPLAQYVDLIALLAYLLDPLALFSGHLTKRRKMVQKKDVD